MFRGFSSKQCPPPPKREREREREGYNYKKKEVISIYLLNYKAPEKFHATEELVGYKRNFEARSCKYCYSGKAKLLRVL
jgi:hypothetical protein